MLKNSTPEYIDIEASNLNELVEISVASNSMLSICCLITASIILIIVLTFYVLFTFN